jgi:hypothetical protein
MMGIVATIQMWCIARDVPEALLPALWGTIAYPSDAAEYCVQP